jgi:hypothetical protein
MCCKYIEFSNVYKACKSISKDLSENKWHGDLKGSNKFSQILQLSEEAIGLVNKVALELNKWCFQTDQLSAMCNHQVSQFASAWAKTKFSLCGWLGRKTCSLVLCLMSSLISELNNLPSSRRFNKNSNM